MSTGRGNPSELKQIFSRIVAENNNIPIVESMETLNNDLTDIERLFSLIKDDQYLIENEREIQKILDRTAKDLEFANEINGELSNVVIGDLIATLNIKWTRLIHIYYGHEVRKLTDINSELSESLNRYQQEIQTTEKEFSDRQKGVLDKLDNIVITVLNVIITFSFVSAAVSGISHVDPVYLPLFLTACLWLPMTFILFITSIYKQKDGNSKQSLFLYIIVTVLTFLIILATIFYMCSADEIRRIGRSSNNNYIEAKQK